MNRVMSWLSDNKADSYRTENKRAGVHREAGCRRIVISVQSDCEERGRAAAEQFRSLRRISLLTATCVASFRNENWSLKARAAQELEDVGFEPPARGISSNAVWMNPSTFGSAYRRPA